jgi:hypothetical protein
MRRWRTVQDQFISPRLQAAENMQGNSRVGAENAIGDYSNYRQTDYGDVNYGGFDPTSYLNTASQHAFRNVSEDFNRQEAGRMASLNSRGLFGSNLGGATAQRGFYDRLANAISGHAMTAAGMAQRAGEFDYGASAANRDYRTQFDQNQLAQRANTAQMRTGMYQSDRDQSNMYFDAMYGATASRKAQDFAEKEAKRNRKAAIVGAGINALGSAAGAAAGAHFGK